MHAYRTHNCAQLRAADVGQSVRLSGWIHRKRDHGGLLFVDLRDHYGLTQIVTDTDSDAFKVLDRARAESVVTITGDVVARDGATVNANLPTGEIEAGVIDSQSVQIAGLTGQLDTARVVNAQLTSDKVALQDTVTNLTSYKNTVYYIAGTEEELLQKGVVVKEGKKFLFFGGKQLHPARSLDPSVFTPMDKTTATAISLPAGEYKMVSRQDLSFADSLRPQHGDGSG